MELRCSFTELHSDASPNRSSSPMTDVFCFAAMQLHGEREPESPSLFDRSGASRIISESKNAQDTSTLSRNRHFFLSIFFYTNSLSATSHMGKVLEKFLYTIIRNMYLLYYYNMYYNMFSLTSDI